MKHPRLPILLIVIVWLVTTFFAMNGFVFARSGKTPISIPSQTAP